jgi:hypothetical protein
MPCETLNILCVSCLPVLSIFQLKIGHWSQACISYTIQLIRAITALQLIVVVSRSLVLMMRYAEESLWLVGGSPSLCLMRTWHSAIM